MKISTKRKMIFLLKTSINCSYAEEDLIAQIDFDGFPFKLNYTGITFGADYTVNNTGCISDISALQDCHSGRYVTDFDNSDGVAGFILLK